MVARGPPKPEAVGSSPTSVAFAILFLHFQVCSSLWYTKHIIFAHGHGTMLARVGKHVSDGKIALVCVD